MNNFDYCAEWVREAAGGGSVVALDYGCGAGQIVEALLRRHVDAYGCDVFYEGGDYLKSMGPGLLGTRVFKMNGGKIPFPDGTFDFVTNNQVMEHVEDLDSVLTEIHRVLKPGGRLLSLFPDRTVWREGHCGIAFLHWFPKKTRPRVYYAAFFRILGFGHFKKNKSVLQWSRDFCEWLDKWTWYRSHAEIRGAYSRYFIDEQHFEEDWLRGKLGSRAWLVRWLPRRFQRLVVRKLAGMVFVCSKSSTPPPIRVLIAIGSLEVGGAERQIVEVCRALSGHGFRFDVVTTEDGGPLLEALERTGARVHSLGFRHREVAEGRVQRALRLVRSVSRFRALLRQIRPQVIHACLVEESLVSAVARWPRRTPPLIISKLSLVRWIARDPVYFLLVRWFNQQADLLLANSEAVALDAMEKEGAEKPKFRIVFNGVDLDRFSPSRPDLALASEMGLPTEIPVIGMVANVNEYKGHIDLLEAAARLRARGRRFTLLFVGRDGNASEAVRTRAAELDIPVVWAGLRDDVERVLSVMDIVVSASHEEGFSNSILEAMAFGRAIVATAVGGNPEQIVDGQNGRLVPPRDPAALAEALDALLDDPALRGRLGQAARQTVEQKFSLQRLGGEMERLYRELAAPGGCSD